MDLKNVRRTRVRRLGLLPRGGDTGYVGQRRGDEQGQGDGEGAHRHMVPRGDRKKSPAVSAIPPARQWPPAGPGAAS